MAGCVTRMQYFANKLLNVDQAGRYKLMEEVRKYFDSMQRCELTRFFYPKYVGWL